MKVAVAKTIFWAGVVASPAWMGLLLYAAWALFSIVAMYLALAGAVAFLWSLYAIYFLRDDAPAASPDEHSAPEGANVVALRGKVS